MDSLISVGKTIRQHDRIENHIKIGSTVDVCCGNKFSSHFQGIVMSKAKEKLKIKFESRKSTVSISKDKIRQYRHKAELSHFQSEILRIGSKVYVHYQETIDGVVNIFKIWPDVYPATIVNINSNGTIVIKYEDDKVNSTEIVNIEDLEFFPDFINYI